MWSNSSTCSSISIRFLHPTPYTLHPTPHTLHPAPYTPRPTPYTPHPTLHPTPCRTRLETRWPACCRRTCGERRLHQTLPSEDLGETVQERIFKVGGFREGKLRILYTEAFETKESVRPKSISLQMSAGASPSVVERNSISKFIHSTSTSLRAVSNGKRVPG